MGRLTGERRALTAAVLAFYSLLFTVVALMPPPGWGRCFAALAGIYGLGFFALVAGYFWARWFVIGIGMSGLISAIISVVQIGFEPTLVFYGATHGAAAAFLWGKAMAERFDGRPGWRERFHMDENGSHRLGKAVIRLGVSLPYMIMYALAPRDGSAVELAVLGGVALAAAGMWAIVRLRTWGVFALGGAGVAALASLSATQHIAPLGNGYAVDIGSLGAAAGLLLIMAAAPFVGPMVRYLRS